MPLHKHKRPRTIRTQTPNGDSLASPDELPHGVVQSVKRILASERLELSRFPRENQGYLRLFIENAPVAIAMFDKEMRYIAASRRWLSDYGLRGKNILGQSQYDVFPKLSRRWKDYLRRGLTGEVVGDREDAFERTDGSVRWLRWELRPWFEAHNCIGGIIIFTEDITARKHAEELLRHANRTLRAIRDCHEAMLRATSEEELLNAVCRIIVETGGERMAWIGFVEHDAARRVRPVAEAGFNKSYVANARITWANTRRGRGPVGLAIRTGRTCICRDTATDPQFAPWRAAARKYGYGSMIALPLIIDREPIGVLAIYAPSPNAFDAEEEQLLADLANDVAYGIANLRIRRERERLEREIVGSIEREQERIGRDLHDGLCQMLVGAKFRSIYLARLLGPRFRQAVREAKALEVLLNQAIEQSRDLARGLNPIRAAADGLELALQRLAGSVDGNQGPHCFCSFPKALKVANHDVAIQLYRIAQEAVQNAVKHAAAKNISISVVQQNGRMTLTVKDDGIGISPKSRRPGMGLDNMRTRAGLIGAQLEIRQRKSGGTAVICEVSRQNHKP